jgi:alginate O-acetyltransferase complex protein AlgI
MWFNSAAFWVFCLAACCLYYLAPRRSRWACLLGASYAFYGTFGWSILGVLVGLTLFVFVVSRVMNRASGAARRLLLAVDIGVPLLALVVFKYLTLIWEAVRYLGAAPGGSAAPVNILVPVGISFYTFKLLSYAFEVYHRRLAVETDVRYFAIYVAYFPQILAGPIERPGDFLPQLRETAPFDGRGVAAGVKLVAWGLFKKLVVANRLAYYVGEVFAAPQYKGLHLVFAAYAYYFQIYCDFSGYSDMSVGISRALGLSAPENFNYPYLSRDVSQFWTRWHITLSTWLRDYLFLPVAYAVMRRVPGDRWAAVSAESWGYGVAMFTTMVLGGLWHGAAWTFVAWGGVHGIYLVSSYASRRVRRRVCRTIGLRRVPRLHHALSVVVTFNLVALAWIPFRAASFENLRVYLRYFQFSLPAAGMANLLFDLAVVLALIGLEHLQRHDADRPVLRRVPIELRAVGYALFVIALVVFSVDANDPFIYFRF